MGAESWPAPEAAPGTVRWCRDFELAEARARRPDAPIHLVFEEVPGCLLIVDAAEAEFEPLCIFSGTEAGL